MVTVSGLSLSEIGRAYFDVGSYDKCRTFFKRLCTINLKDSYTSFLDSICKMLILNDVVDIGQWKTSLDRLNRNRLKTNHFQFHTKMLYCCCLIRNKQYELTLMYARDILKEQKENPSHKNCFREPLLFAKYFNIKERIQTSIGPVKNRGIFTKRIGYCRETYFKWRSD